MPSLVSNASVVVGPVGRRHPTSSGPPAYVRRHLREAAPAHAARHAARDNDERDQIPAGHLDVLLGHHATSKQAGYTARMTATGSTAPTSRPPPSSLDVVARRGRRPHYGHRRRGRGRRRPPPPARSAAVAPPRPGERDPGGRHRRTVHARRLPRRERQSSTRSAPASRTYFPRRDSTSRIATSAAAARARRGCDA